MNKFLVIMKREYALIVKKPSFIILTLLTPVLMGVLMVGPAYFMAKSADEAESIAIIDQSGINLGAPVTEAMVEYKLEDDTSGAYELNSVETLGINDTDKYDEVYEQLVQSIVNRELDYLLVLKPGSHLADSNIIVVTNSDSRRTLNRFNLQISQQLARHRLTESNLNITVDSAMDMMRTVSAHRQDTKGSSIHPAIKRLSGMVLIMLIYFLIMFDGQSLMGSVLEEKANRIVEVLLSSVTPFQLMTGKIVGTGLAALTQVAIWIGAGALMMVVTNRADMELDPTLTGIIFNPATVVSFVGFLVLGYLFYSTFYAAIGAIANSEKEARPLLMPIIFVLFIPAMMIAISFVPDNPNADWIRVVSYIPTFTPLVMMMRVAVLAPTLEGNPLASGLMLEAGLGMLSLVVGLVIMLWITSRIFRVGILMYGKRPSLPEIIKWIRYK